MHKFSFLRSVLFLFVWAITVASPVRATEQLRLSAPSDYEVRQRSSRTEGNVQIAGSIDSASTGRVIESRTAGTNGENGWRKIAEVPAGEMKFQGELTLPAGGWYRLQVRAKSGEEIASEAEVPHVGVGEVFVIAGQSNSANHGEEKQQSKSGLVAAFSGSGWTPANDPQPGASGNGGSFMPHFGDLLADRLKVPIGIVATGVGATSVREWLPKGARFSNPPTLLGNVRQVSPSEWESTGRIFQDFTGRLKQLGKSGFRAVLWHQGESDANQTDPSRTLSGDLYRQFLDQLIRQTRREAGWDIPWFVAQASYHTPEDPGSPEIRAAQEALWKSGVALQGPDTDALASEWRDGGGRGVHFNGKGLREHAVRWTEKVAPWIEKQIEPARGGAPGPLALPANRFTIEDRPAFLLLPPKEKQSKPQPWIFYAPTLPAYPDEAERWMHEQFLAAGIAVAGVDVGEAYGSPKSHPVFNALHRELVENRNFAEKPCLLGRSRGGLWVTSWAIANTGRVAGIAGIYPVFDFSTYPGIAKAAPAYGVTPEELTLRAESLNPISMVHLLAKAGIPATLIHGDDDKVVPLKENSAEFLRRYREAGAESLVDLIILEGQGHSFYEGFFHSRELVDFAIARARAGANQ